MAGERVKGVKSTIYPPTQACHSVRLYPAEDAILQTADYRAAMATAVEICLSDD